MAGFDKVKRKLEILNPQSQKYEIIFDDSTPIRVGYTKLYEDEEMQDFSNNLFNSVVTGLCKGTYRFSIDTLGAYINSVVIYKVEIKPVISVVESNLTD